MKYESATAFMQVQTVRKALVIDFSKNRFEIRRSWSRAHVLQSLVITRLFIVFETGPITNEAALHLDANWDAGRSHFTHGPRSAVSPR